MIEQLILHILDVHATTGVSANLLDSEGAGVRVYHNRIRQGHGKNAVVFNVLSQNPDYRKGGIGQHEYSVSFNVHHESDYEAATIANNLVDLVEGWKGSYDSKTWHYTLLERMADGFDDDQDLPRKVVDFQFIREN